MPPADVPAALQVRIRAAVRATEDPAKVRLAILALFPDAQIAAMEGGLEATTASLAALRRRVFELRIIDTFRGQFLHGIDAAGGVATFRLSKQAALANHVSFPPREHALGDLHVEVRLEPADHWTDATALAWHLAPATKDGEVVGPVEP